MEKPPTGFFFLPLLNRSALKDTPTYCCWFVTTRRRAQQQQSHKNLQNSCSPDTTSCFTMTSLNDLVPAGVITGDDVLTLMEHARANGYALPAVNCTRYEIRTFSLSSERRINVMPLDALSWSTTLFERFHLPSPHLSHSPSRRVFLTPVSQFVYGQLCLGGCPQGQVCRYYPGFQRWRSLLRR